MTRFYTGLHSRAEQNESQPLRAVTQLQSSHDSQNIWVGLGGGRGRKQGLQVRTVEIWEFGSWGIFSFELLMSFDNWKKLILRRNDENEGEESRKSQTVSFILTFTLTSLSCWLNLS